jgi:hypothetical protein
VALFQRLNGVGLWLFLTVFQIPRGKQHSNQNAKSHGTNDMTAKQQRFLIAPWHAQGRGLWGNGRVAEVHLFTA